MSYCFNPSCSHPENPGSSQVCKSCESLLIKLNDRYTAIRALAQGGFGATFLAKDDSLPGEPVCVIKQLRPTTNTPEVLKMARELFAREANTLGRIGNHPQIPRLLDYFEDDNQQFYLVQEFVNGWTIQQEIKRNGPMSEAGVKQFLSEILGILQYIHSQQVIHRDIKPNNLIRRSEDGRLVLIDFGAVKNQVTHTLGNQHEANTAFAVGTAGFAPPEQIAMRPVYASDVYAVGITCLYLLTGKSPKDFDYNSLTGEMQWEKEVHLSPDMIDVLKRMLQASVRHRYQSAQDVLNALGLLPYVESMSKGMVTQPTKRNSSSSTQERSNSYTAQSVTDQAEGIRRARQKKSPETVGMGATATHQQSLTKQIGIPATKTSNPSGSKVKEVSRMGNDSLLSAYDGGRREFNSKDLSSLNLQEKNLSGIKCRAAILSRTNLQKANLCDSDFEQAKLNQAILANAKLSNANLSHADLSGANLRGADLRNADLSKAKLTGTNLDRANLTGAKVTDEQLALAKINWFTVGPNGKRGYKPSVSLR